MTAPRSPRARSRLACALASVFLVVAATPLVINAPTAHADGTGTTETGNFQRWLPLANGLDDNGAPSGAYDESSTPTVTVDQTQDLVDQVVQVNWSNFTPSSNDFTYTSEPTEIAPFSAGTSNLYSVSIVECRGLHPKLPPTAKGTTCFNGYANTASVDAGHGQGNIVQVNTAPDGTGTASFHIENRPTNDFLGCSSTQPCSLVVVPNNGGLQPLDGTAKCNDHSEDESVPPDYLNDVYADALGFAFATCSWRDRIVFPLTFAKLPRDCPAVAPAFSAVGSPNLGRGLGQLQSGWCRGRNSLAFNYDSTTDEYAARQSFFAGSGALTQSTDVALVTDPADPSVSGERKFTYAPVMNNAITIPYYVDNPNTGRPITDLRLDARLVAKLLTESYQPLAFNCDFGKQTTASSSCAPAVNGNPASIFDDPEFQQLNMGAGHPDHPDRSDFPSDTTSTWAFFPTVVAGQSDATYELTRWVEADPDARAFLQGRRDPWGMRVNSNYLPTGLNGGASYPTSQFQPLDPGWSARPASAQRFTVGFQIVWNPITGWDRLSSTLVSNGTTADNNQGTCEAADVNSCNSDPHAPVGFKTLPTEFIGSRALFAVTDNSAAASYEFPTAELVNTAGNAVAPTTRSMTFAVEKMKTNPDGITQYVNHRAESPRGYPLTVTDYAMVPTCGLSARKAAAISSFLQHVQDSQVYGVQPGTIAPGLLALTTPQLKQLRAAQQKVSTQPCTSPPADPQIDGRTVHHTNSTPRGNNGASDATGPAGGSGAAATTGGGATGAGGNTTATPTPSGSPSSSSANAQGVKPLASDTSLGWALPVLLIVGLVFLLGGPLTWWVTATAAGQAAVRRIGLRR